MCEAACSTFSTTLSRELLGNKAQIDVIRQAYVQGNNELTFVITSQTSDFLQKTTLSRHTTARTSHGLVDLKRLCYLRQLSEQ